MPPNMIRIFIRAEEIGEGVCAQCDNWSAKGFVLFVGNETRPISDSKGYPIQICEVCLKRNWTSKK